MTRQGGVLRAEARTTGERIAKVMARAGLCSRREAEAWVAAGRVAVNGRKIDSPALNVTPSDRIMVDDVALPAQEPTRLWRLHKTRGTVTSRVDPEGRPVLFDKLPAEMPRVVSVGRLDINTEGLLLLTNDGHLSRALELPATGWLRRYRVRVHGPLDPRMLDALREGVTVDGVRYGSVDAKVDWEQGTNSWLTLGLREGKNREIKRLLRHFELHVTRLIRVSFGPFQLGDLEAGSVEEVRPRVLRDQLGEKILKEHRITLPDSRADKPGASGAVPKGGRAAAKRSKGAKGMTKAFSKPGAKPARRDGPPTLVREVVRARRRRPT
ncbi:MAG: pseudouridine synthase [Pseudomonadota bacterium]